MNNIRPKIGIVRTKGELVLRRTRNNDTRVLSVFDISSAFPIAWRERNGIEAVSVCTRSSICNSLTESDTIVDIRALLCRWLVFPI